MLDIYWKGSRRRYVKGNCYSIEGNMERMSGLMDLINWHLSMLSSCMNDSGETFLELLSRFNGAGSYDEFMENHEK